MIHDIIKIKIRYLPEYLAELLGEKPAKLRRAHDVDQEVGAGIQQQEELASIELMIKCMF